MYETRCLGFSEDLSTISVSKYGEDEVETVSIELDDVEKAIEILEEASELADTVGQYLREIKLMKVYSLESQC